MSMARRLLPLVLVVLAACGGSDGASDAPNEPSDASDPVSTEAGTAPAQTITSPDGLVTLDIPAGAVPADVEITIELEQPSEGSLVGYEFLPDGLVFAAPATVSVEVALDEVAPGESVRPVRPVWFSGDGTEDEQIDFSVTRTDGGILVSGEIDHFSYLRMIHGGFATVVQEEPGEFVEFESMFEASFRATADDDETELSAEEDDPYERTCVPFGAYSSSAILLLLTEPIEDRIYGFVLTSATTNCVVVPDVAELLLLPMGPADDPFTGSVLFRVGDGTVDFGFSLDEVPDGGTIGLGLEGADQKYFGQCIIERRAGEPSGCAVFDRSGLSMELIPIFESIEDEIIWMRIPADFLDLTAGTMAEPPISIGIVTVDRFDANGESTHAFVDLTELEALLLAS